MADGKYGRLFTEHDVQELINRAYAKGGVDEDQTGCSLMELIDPRHTIAYETDFPADEPLFLLRGKDMCAPSTITAYEGRCRAFEAPEGHLQEVRVRATEMHEWQVEHPDLVKVPD